ncbi:MFS transporter, DHA1 family, bicyclomycin/chloramphenicol resistance protein [Oceanospirillum multiglobuliferum]|uniref:Bcr/CflA family efflux transporter n=1 Tax=Oceanospirillum multiglobuliferum TaxID=64969 RepID=A0A1T4PS83_9GAMM|nr:multidrug effflux MFS transporter [Oceanospirillum multiglobuliferum]OPX55352.1 Bcr/CflA family drug resistance efflux transporter [Oceanospirillum multiglobuliferum]SJZ94161.1 MFS transporter, DHA1 family, bicyclomycin/chloramphenicol resistance protein [Oceanospirillum multiglobuliferum]
MPSTQKKPLPFGEFIALLALLMSLVALAIDAVLPAMLQVGHALQVTDTNQLQLMIGVVFLGLAIGQIFYGPLSDSVGRKPAIYLGLVVFFIGSAISVLAESYEMMLWGRFIQGIGASGPKVIAVALVRDQYEGRAMARVMSFVMAVFIVMPALAPSLGAGILLFFGWREIFGFFMLHSALALFWFARRQPETLVVEKRVPFSAKNIWAGTKTTLGNPISRAYIIAAGLVFGVFIAYLSTAQQLFLDIFQVDTLFPLYFAMLALAIGMASLINGRLVMKYGMQRMANFAMKVMMAFSVLFVGILLANQGQVPLWVFMLFTAIIFFCVGLLFGNMNALAMAPLGHIAGLASSVIGSATTFISMFFGIIIGQTYNQTLYPLFLAFAGLALGAFLITRPVQVRDEVS